MHKTQKKLIIANWKMNPDSVGRAVRIAREISSGVSGIKNIKVIIAPSFVHIPIIFNLQLPTSNIQIGAQDAFWEDVGSHTGEVSWRQLKHFGAEYVIVGHSEKRSLGETDEMVNKKLKAVVSSGMKAVLCVGETEKKKDVVFSQEVFAELKNGLKNIKNNFLKNLIVVYEPVWAISTNKKAKADNPKNVFEKTILIRKELFRMFGKRVAFGTPILYGGSVDEKNAADFVRLGKVDGLLVGSASLSPKKFIKIVKNVSKI